MEPFLSITFSLSLYLPRFSLMKTVGLLRKTRKELFPRQEVCLGESGEGRHHSSSDLLSCTPPKSEREWRNEPSAFYQGQHTSACAHRHEHTHTCTHRRTRGGPEGPQAPGSRAAIPPTLRRRPSLGGVWPALPPRALAKGSVKGHQT